MDVKSDIQHVLDKPNTYIGTRRIGLMKNVYLCDEDLLIQQKEVRRSQGFHNCFIEEYINARDHCYRDPLCDTIEVIIN